MRQFKPIFFVVATLLSTGFQSARAVDAFFQRAPKCQPRHECRTEAVCQKEFTSTKWVCGRPIVTHYLEVQYRTYYTNGTTRTFRKTYKTGVSR
ncbi:MAG: hypothetical protein AAF226_01395 [Verrucomicrobiota bacterium]